MPLPRVLGLGEVLWDLQPHGRQLGGAPGNFAYHCHAQGFAAAPVSAVGDDDLGRDLLAELRQRDVDTQLVAVLDDKPTSTVDVELNAAGKPTYTIHEGVAWDYLPASDDVLAAARQAQAVCFGSLAQRNDASRQSIQQILDATPADCLRVFDVNLRQHYYDAGVLDESLGRTTIFKLSDDEVDEVAKLLGLPADHAAFGDALFTSFPKLDLLVLTRGGEGSTLRRRDGETSDHPQTKPPGEVVSTVGAGDSFTAGVVSGLLAGKSLAEAHDLAARLSAFVVTQPGAMPDVPAELRV
jgi:fructokinase